LRRRRMTNRRKEQEKDNNLGKMNRVKGKGGGC
jgi:hypothetical protein